MWPPATCPCTRSCPAAPRSRDLVSHHLRRRRHPGRVRPPVRRSVPRRAGARGCGAGSRAATVACGDGVTHPADTGSCSRSRRRPIADVTGDGSVRCDRVRVHRRQRRVRHVARGRPRRRPRGLARPLCDAQIVVSSSARSGSTLTRPSSSPAIPLLSQRPAHDRAHLSGRRAVVRGSGPHAHRPLVASDWDSVGPRVRPCSNPSATEMSTDPFRFGGVAAVHCDAWRGSSSKGGHPSTAHPSIRTRRWRRRRGPSTPRWRPPTGNRWKAGTTAWNASRSWTASGASTLA